DAISDVLNSIAQLSKHGLSDVISINPINIQKFTLVEHLFSRHDYRPPWLWSVVEVLTRGAGLLSDGRIRLLSHPTAGGLRTGAHNCGACDKVVLKAINEFSLTGDVAVFQAPELDCDCREKWRDILELENITKSNLINLPE
ncbi:MAG: TIGR01210 family radical SAM protein, partial [Thermoplasmata archaeon]|nr:TIGR01210 family radical SAM protein [Thermoplasmata archaeon]